MRVVSSCYLAMRFVEELVEDFGRVVNGGYLITMGDYQASFRVYYSSLA